MDYYLLITDIETPPPLNTEEGRRGQIPVHVLDIVRRKQNSGRANRAVELQRSSCSSPTRVSDSQGCVTRPQCKLNTAVPRGALQHTAWRGHGAMGQWGMGEPGGWRVPLTLGEGASLQGREEGGAEAGAAAFREAPPSRPRSRQSVDKAEQSDSGTEQDRVGQTQIRAAGHTQRAGPRNTHREQDHGTHTQSRTEGDTHREQDRGTHTELDRGTQSTRTVGHTDMRPLWAGSPRSVVPGR